MKVQAKRSTKQPVDIIHSLLNALFVIVLCGVLFTAYGYQYLLHQTPCPLCLLQRLGMIGVALGAFLNVRLGPHPLHYAFSLLSALFGGAVALRQISLHICPDSEVYGVPFMGLNLYTWSFITFACSVLVIAIFMAIPSGRPPSRMDGLGYLAGFLLVIVVLGNVVSTVALCGLGPCEG